MKQLTKSLVFVAAVAFGAGTIAPVAAEAQSLDSLLQQVKQDRISEKKLNKKREQEFLSERADKQALLKKAKAALKAEQARAKRLQQAFSDNETRLANKEVELENAKGTLGEMFGVVRQSAGEAIGRISTSIVSAQFPGRSDVLESLAEAKKLPTLPELEELWIALQTEMTESGKVARFTTKITDLEGGNYDAEIVRVGTFNLVDGDGNYLQFVDQSGQVQPLGRQPEGYVTSAADNFFGTQSGFSPVYIDPSRGQILGLLTQKATMEERYHQGGIVGYVITAVLAFGLLIALERILVLFFVGGKMRSQLKNTDAPKDNNPLGRILKVYAENKASADVENLELKLDEAVMREIPRIERGVSIIKILAAIAPLLGLLGTVTGMIGTFQSITLFGAGDPKIMAGDISMALVTTAMGLIAALPLILIHSVVAGRSKAIVQVLDEQSAGIIAAHAEKEHS